MDMPLLWSILNSVGIPLFVATIIAALVVYLIDRFVLSPENNNDAEEPNRHSPTNSENEEEQDNIIIHAHDELFHNEDSLQFSNTQFGIIVLLLSLQILMTGYMIFKLERMDQRSMEMLERLDRRLDRLDQRLDRLDQRLERLESILKEFLAESILKKGEFSSSANQSYTKNLFIEEIVMGVSDKMQTTGFPKLEKLLKSSENDGKSFEKKLESVEKGMILKSCPNIGFLSVIGSTFSLLSISRVDDSQCPGEESEMFQHKWSNIYYEFANSKNQRQVPNASLKDNILYSFYYILNVLLANVLPFFVGIFIFLCLFRVLISCIRKLYSI